MVLSYVTLAELLFIEGLPQTGGVAPGYTIRPLRGPCVVAKFFWRSLPSRVSLTSHP
jgi:hypothetical protein